MYYTCTNFKGFVLQSGTSAVVCAESKERAALALEVELEKLGLAQKIHPDNMIPLHDNEEEEKVEILFDGEL